MMSEIHTELYAEQSDKVNEEDTASHFGSGTVDVYATPAMINLIEAAAPAAIEPYLTSGQTSVDSILFTRAQTNL
jgi:fluoroacetyl-CoA thioesterase